MMLLLVVAMTEDVMVPVKFEDGNSDDFDGCGIQIGKLGTVMAVVHCSIDKGKVGR